MSFFVPSWARMSAHCVAGWLLAKKQQDGAAWTDVIDGGGENDCGARYGCCYPIGMAVGEEQNREDDVFLLEDLIEDEELNLVLLTSQPLHVGFPHLLSFWSW